MGASGRAPKRLFDTRAVPLALGLLIIDSGVMVFVILEVEKQIRLCRQRPRA